jgi:catecholate siderophore receptor
MDRFKGGNGAAGVRSFAKGMLQAATLASASTLAFAVLNPAMAQTGPSEDDQRNDKVVVEGMRDRELQTSKVTAPLADTPKSITVIPAEIIEATGAVTLTDALRTIPGITLGSGEGGVSAGDRPFIRGVDSTNDVFVDGVRDAGVTSREVFNMEQVEVSRGPSGAFAGRGSTGGSINLVSKQPRLENFTAGSIGLGTDETQRITADVNYMLSDTAAFRLNAMHHDANVAGRDAVTLSRWGVAPSVAFGLGTRLRSTISYYHLESDDVPDYGIPYLRQPAVIDPVYGSIVFATPITGHDDDFYGLLNRDFRRAKSDIGTVRVEYDLAPGLTLSNVTRYGRGGTQQVVTNPDDSRGNVANGYVFRASKNRGVDLTTIANITDLRGEQNLFGMTHSFDIGMEASRETNHVQGFYVVGPNLPATPGAPAVGTNVSVGTTCSNPALVGAASSYNCTTLDNPNPNDPWVGSIARALGYTDTTTDVVGLYVFDTIAFNPQWSLNVGLRYDDYSTKQKGLTATASTTAPFYTLAIPTPLARQDDFLNYQLGLVYKPVEEGTFYISTGTSTNPSGEGSGESSTLSAALQILAPEENTSYEAGVKWQLFDHALLATAAVFRTEKTNARVTDALGGTSSIGDQEVNGVELSLSGQITPDWFVFGGYTHLESELTDNGFQIIGGVPVPSAANGKQFPNTPEDSFSAWTNYNITDALTVGGGASYMSDRYADTTNRISIPSYWRYEAVVTYTFSDNLDVQLNLNNISDERYVTNPYTSHMAQIAAGRSALLTLNVKY